MHAGDSRLSVHPTPSGTHRPRHLPPVHDLPFREQRSIEQPLFDLRERFCT